MNHTPIIGANGKPLVLVTNGAAEKIGLPNYSSVTVGPAEVSRWVEDTPEAIQAGLRQCWDDAEVLLVEKRDTIQKALRGDA